MIQNRPFWKDAEICRNEQWENNKGKAISNIQACNPVLVVPPNTIINPILDF